jgi:hypothetical protein
VGLLAAAMVVVALGAAAPIAGLTPVAYHLIPAGAAVLCLSRAWLRTDVRLAWAAMGVAVALWSCGDLYWVLFLADTASPPALSPAECCG